MAGKNIKNLNLTMTARPARITDKISKNRLVSVRECLWLIVLLLLFFSCRTVPRFSDTLFDDFLPLGVGASVYMFADVQVMKPVFEIFLANELVDKHARQMLDRTGFAVGAFFPQESGQSFQLAAWGNYPNSGARMGFGMSRNWKRQRSAEGQTYWHSAANRLSIAVTSGQAFVASSLSNVSANPYASGAEIPEGFNEFRHGSPGLPASLSCWLENPGPMLSKIMYDAGLPLRFPVRNLFININAVTAEESRQYEAIIRLQFENTSQARGLVSILNLAYMFELDDLDTIFSAIFLANPPVQDGINVDLKTAALSETEIIDLFNLFNLF